MEWNTEENFSMEWNMEWKIFRMEWKKIARMEYGKIVFHSIPYHALFVKTKQARSQKQKAAVIVINSYMSSAAKCLPRL